MIQITSYYSKINKSKSLFNTEEDTPHLLYMKYRS